MIRGTRVCIVKPPKGRKDLKGMEGKVVSLHPFASVPLKYNIHIQNKLVLLLPFTSVKILDYEETVETGYREDRPVLKVNGLRYCKNHRLEICCECGYNFLMQNLGAELRNDTDDAMEGTFSRRQVLAEELNIRRERDFLFRQRLAGELKSLGAPVRTAPLTNLKCNSASEARTAPLKNLKCNSAMDAVIGIPEGTNLLSLEEVPTGVSLFSAFDHQFWMAVCGEPEREHGPEGGLYKVRTTFCSIGNCVDRAKRESRQIPRICLQDESRIAKGFSFDGLIIDVIDARMIDSYFPALVLAMSRSEDMAASTNGIFKEGFQIEVFRMKPNEIDLFVKIVQANAARLSNSEDDFLFNGVKILKDHSVFKIGVVTPIGSNESKRYHELHGKCCGFCGDSNSKLFKCSGCKNVLYCGRSCQKSDWKMHKLVCSASSK